MYQQELDDADVLMENFKKNLGPSILEMTMGELSKYQLYDDIEITLQQNINDMNMTIKETLKENLQKCDDGKYILIKNLFMFRYLGFILFSTYSLHSFFVINTIFIINFL